MPRLAHHISDLNAQLASSRDRGASVGFVPTMGALHNGHLSLVRAALEENAQVVVSIFVNPTQFAPHEDYDSYPRTLERDLGLLGAHSDDIIVFNPDGRLMYPEGSQISVKAGHLADILDGQSRPHFFHGVATVVAKLFNLVRPTKAYFGAKDFQQTVIIRHLIEELFFDIELVVCPTEREDDGLAMSSRNQYLTADERPVATTLYEALQAVQAERDSLHLDTARALVQQIFAPYPQLELDYFDIRAAKDLRLLERWTPEDQPVALIAAMLGKTRLIDNLRLYPVETAEE